MPLKCSQARFASLSILAGGLAAAALVLGPERAGAGGMDSASVRGYIVASANNPDVSPATTCAGTFAANDQFDSQAQSPAGTTANAVSLAGCSYDFPPYGGPSTEDRPAAFGVISGPGGLLCGPGIQQSQACGLSAINYAAGAEYRVLVNNEAGVNATGATTVEFCADDPPVQGVCGPEDEETTQYTIDWKAAAKCAGKAATITATAAKTTGTAGEDVIVGRPDNDKISGQGGKDRICGKGGKDELKGGGGKDRLEGGPGADTLDGGPGKDTCKGGGGKDELKGCEAGS